VSEARAVAPEVLQGAARTDPGRARTNNEDLPLIDPARGIFGVIDGVGGQAGGEVAAAIARDVILQRLARPLGTPAERVREAIAIANNEIFRRSQESADLRGMACVITLAIVADGRLVVGHVGDSRLYKVRADGVRKLTLDHSPIGEREDAGELNEVDAMRHPRRNEVYRDVGSLHRDKDEEEFVDVTEEPFERDSAILVCSDGLSDMVPSPTIAHIIRQYAGDPPMVVEALVGAANDAGGKDNVTVVYAEGPLFAPSLRSRSLDTLTPTEPLDNGTRNGSFESAQAPSGDGLFRRFARAVVRSRTTWFVVGTLLGVTGALALMTYVARTQVKAPETHVVSSDGSAPFLRIAQAMAVAKSGDTVRVEPGEYQERVIVPDGVDLMARIPGSVIVSRPAGLDPSLPGVVAGGAQTTRISGIRIASPPASPGETGISIGGDGVTLELVQIVGASKHAIGLAAGASVTMLGSRVEAASGVISIPDGSQATFGNSIFVRTAPSSEPPITAGSMSRLTLTGNLFSGFEPEIVRGLSAARRKEVLEGNIVVPPEAPPRRSTGNRR
jgi:serine/threonine protein phosphatase PrpC